jgi:hypothetical protein
VTFGIFALAVLAGLPLAGELGYWIGRGRVPRHAHEIEHIVHWQNGVLAIAGLLIGFTFAMATSRYEARKQVLVDEANAIENAILRTQLIDEATGRELRVLFRSYVDARIAVFDAGVDQVRTDQAEAQCTQLAEQIWSRVATVARADPHAVTTTLLLESINKMRDFAALRRDAKENPVPWTVFLALILSAAVAMASVGYACALTGRRLSFGMIVMPLLVAGVIFLVYDLATPQSGLIRPNNQAALRLRDRL